MGSLISKQRFKFWQRNQSDGKNHQVFLSSDLLYIQKLNYLHWHPATTDNLFFVLHDLLFM
jgi:hypothetical protein